MIVYEYLMDIIDSIRFNSINSWIWCIKIDNNHQILMYKSHVCIEKNISKFAPPRASARAAAAGRNPPGRRRRTERRVRRCSRCGDNVMTTCNRYLWPDLMTWNVTSCHSVSDWYGFCLMQMFDAKIFYRFLSVLLLSVLKCRCGQVANAGLTLTRQG